MLGGKHGVVFAAFLNLDSRRAKAANPSVARAARLGNVLVEQVVFLLPRAASAGSRAPDQERRAQGDESLSPVGVQVGEVPQNIVKMKKPHKLNPGEMFALASWGEQR